MRLPLFFLVATSVLSQHRTRAFNNFLAQIASVPEKSAGAAKTARPLGGGPFGRAAEKASNLPRGGRDAGPSGAPALRLSPEAIRLAETLAPKVGVVTSTLLYLSPAAAVLAAARDDDVGDLNPLPLAIMSFSTFAWLAYGLSVRDPYVIASNVGGCVAAVAYIAGILPLLRGAGATLRTAQATVVSGAAATVGLWTYLALSEAKAAAVSSALGLFASALFILLSVSPLSTIRTVLSTRNAASILAPLTAAQVFNTSLWSAYGLAVKDKFVWGPNVVGLGLGCVQLFLKILFPNKRGGQ